MTIVATTPAPDNKTTTQHYAVAVGNRTTVESLAYDRVGNLVSDQGGTVGAEVTYGWDAANRLVKISKPGAVTEFVYDGRSRRVAEKLNGTVIKQWIWFPDAAQPAEERDASNAVTRRFYAGQGEQINGTNYYYTTDSLGSVCQMSDARGAVRARYRYDPYGRSTQVSGDLEASFGYTGYYNHTSSGLRLALYRAYSPRLGRWLNRDPIGERGRINLYGYVYNDPINWIDALGLDVTVHSRDVSGTGGAGAHSWVEVSDSSGRNSFSGIKDANGNLGVRKDYPSDCDAAKKGTETSKKIVPPPAGMTQAEWDKKVRESAEKELKKDSKRDYKLFGGDGGKKSGNCHTTTSDILEGAGGSVPKDWDPPGAQSGLRQ